MVRGSTETVGPRRRARASAVALAVLVALAVPLAVPGSPVAGASSVGAEPTDEHTVRLGETLSAIAHRFRVGVAALAAANAISNPDVLFAGQRLRIPAAGGSASADEGVHVVAPGETLGRIAARYGVPVAALAAANGIVDPDVVWAGIRLRISARPVPYPSVSGAATVRIRPGDTLSAIAARHGVSLGALAEANAIANPDRIRAGAELVVPGAWQCPVVGPVRFVNDFGVPKGASRFHEGVDLYAPRGTPVVASVSGVVEHRTGVRAGHQYLLRGDDGHVYVGTHLESFGASGRVRAGDVVGFVGTSGNAAGTAPHLHFEYHPDGGTPANPYPLLREACGR